MNKEQAQAASALIQDEPMLCAGLLAVKPENLSDGDVEYYKDNIEGSVKMVVPKDFNCAMGALAQDCDIPVARLLDQGTLDMRTHSNGEIMESVVGEKFGLSHDQQAIVMAVNDGSSVARRKSNVIRLFNHFAETEHASPLEQADWAAKEFDVSIDVDDFESYEPGW